LEAHQNFARKNAEARESIAQRVDCAGNDERSRRPKKSAGAERRRLEGEEENERRYQEAVEQQDRSRARMYADDEDDGEDAPHEWSDDDGRSERGFPIGEADKGRERRGVWVDPAKCWARQRLRKVIEPEPEKSAPPSPSRSPLASPNGGASERTSSPARAGRVHEFLTKARTRTSSIPKADAKPVASGEERSWWQRHFGTPKRPVWR
jgi:hypothetical protein